MSETARWLSAIELADAYRTGELTPEAVAVELLDAVDQVDPSVNAFCLVDRDATLAAAREAGERFRAGTPLGPLDGVPVSIKDLLLTRGWPTLRGSLMIESDQMAWDTDAPAVARLREAGAVMLGKVTTPEFGWKGVTDSPRTGITRNPWHLGRTSGGSSGGAVAGVAAGCGPLAIGTDAVGAIRVPSSFCGVFGIKPTFGLVPRAPSFFPPSWGSLAHTGPIGWTVADVARAGGFDLMPSPGPTWISRRLPMSLLPLGLPIDQVFAKGDVRVHAVTRAEPVGSDHLPLLVDFSVASPARSPADELETDVAADQRLRVSEETRRSTLPPG